MPKIHVIGNKVDIPDKDVVCKHNNNNIVFVGKMNYAPNVVAVMYFAKEIMPKLCLHFPDLKFIIVGACPTQRVLDLSDVYPNIVVTGFVESIEPYLQNATIVVAPMLTGAGIQNKIIQAMSYSCCVVTTPVGAEGLDIMDRCIGICENSVQMVDAILTLLRDRSLRVQMGELSRQHVIDKFSSEVVALQFWDFISSVNKI